MKEVKKQKQQKGGIMNKIKCFNWKLAGRVAMVIALVLLGVTATLQYQKFIGDIKAQGVTEFKDRHCDKYSNKEKTQFWLECEIK